MLHDKFDKRRVEAISTLSAFVRNTPPRGWNWILSATLMLPVFVILSCIHTLGMTWTLIKVMLQYVMRGLFVPLVMLWILGDLLVITVWFLSVLADRLSEEKKV